MGLVEQPCYFAGGFSWTVAYLRGWVWSDSRILRGWPDECGDEELKSYWSRRTELSTQQGCLLWGSRVVVPSSLRASMLKELHDTHPGVSHMKSLGCMFIWWPGFDQQVEDHGVCGVVIDASAPIPHLLHPWALPSRPWARLHCDYAGPFLGHCFLVVIDAYSKWLEVCPITSTTTATVEWLHVLFAQFGLPEMLVTDNGLIL